VHDANRPLSTAEKKVVDRLKRITAGLRDVVVERDGFGHSVLRVRKRSFVFIGAQNDVVYVSIKSDLVTQDALVRRGPWQRTPYIGQHGWVSFASTDEPDWQEVEELVREAYTRVAPRRSTRKRHR